VNETVVDMCVQMCIGQRCTAVSSLPVLSCPDCHSHGVCCFIIHSHLNILVDELVFQAAQVKTVQELSKPRLTTPLHAYV